MALTQEELDQRFPAPPSKWWYIGGIVWCSLWLIESIFAIVYGHVSGWINLVIQPIGIFFSVSALRMRNERARIRAWVIHIETLVVACDQAWDPQKRLEISKHIISLIEADRARRRKST